MSLEVARIKGENLSLRIKVRNQRRQIRQLQNCLTEARLKYQNLLTGRTNIQKDIEKATKLINELLSLQITELQKEVDNPLNNPMLSDGSTIKIKTKKGV